VAAPAPHIDRADRLMPWIAGERMLRAVVLVAVGLVLVTHVHSDWASWIQRTARSAGFDPTRGFIKRLTARAGALRPKKIVEYGVIAIGFGAMEGVEGYGLWHRRRWAEYLTIVATALLFVPEIDELFKKPTVLKGAALLVNAAIVVYLIWRLRLHGQGRVSSA
jgi:uncharacterized membrane protein (DUF2068 family)